MSALAELILSRAKSRLIGDSWRPINYCDPNYALSELLRISEKLFSALIHFSAIPLITAAVSKITDVIALDQRFGC